MPGIKSAVPLAIPGNFNLGPLAFEIHPNSEGQSEQNKYKAFSENIRVTIYCINK